MTKKEILKNFPIPTKFGVCENCAYYYMTKEFVQSNMSNLLEDIRRNCISINLGVVDTMWVCDVMNNEKMGSLIAFAYESPQCDTPVDALYDAYTWLIKNGKVELDA